MNNKRILAAAVLALLLLTACSKANQPAPAQSPAPAATAPAAPAQAPAATPVPAGGKRYTLVKEQSKASYVATELLAGATVRNQAIGTTSEIAGELVFDASGKPKPAAFTVDLRTLRSDRSTRDNYIRTAGLESNKYPTATFNLAEIKGSPTFEAGKQETFQIVGAMKVRETERNVTWSVTSTVEDGNLKWHAILNTKLTEWGINPPVLLVRSVAEIDDPLKLEVVLVFKPAAG